MSRPDPSRIVETLCAYWQTAALTAAINLGVFTALGGRMRSASQLAHACHADRAALVRLCDSLVSLGFLRAAHGGYRSAADAARFLDARSADSLVALPGFFNTPPVTAAFANLAATIRRRPSARRAAASGRVWQGFAATTLALRRRVAREIADALAQRCLTGGRILDIGAGASPLGIELLRRTPAASLVVQDRPPVVTLARQHAIAAGVVDRVATIAGDALAVDWGGPFDLVLMVNVLDYFDLSAQARLLRKARAALRPGGALVVAAPLVDEGRRSPPDAVSYDLLLLALQSPGRPATLRERRQQLRRARFARVTRCVSPPLVLARKAP